MASMRLLVPLLFALVALATGPVTAEDDTNPEVRFLVATPNLNDPTFGRSVILMLKHNEDGALGVIVNRATPASIAEVFPHLERGREREDTVYLGGPVQPSRIFLLMRTQEAPPASDPVMPGVFVSQRQPSFDHVLENDWPAQRFRVMLGYAGWGAGQLENELKRGDWRFHPAHEQLLFDIPPEHLWEVLQPQTRGQWAIAW